jgi:hypothetical protein
MELNPVLLTELSAAIRRGDTEAAELELDRLFDSARPTSGSTGETDTLRTSIRTWIQQGRYR